MSCTRPGSPSPTSPRASGIHISPVVGLPELRKGDNLGHLIGHAATDLDEADIVVISQKAVSKVEGRMRELASVKPGHLAQELGHAHGKDPRLVQIVLDESADILRSERGILICETRHGLVCANAGVDQSNVPDGHVLLLPLDPDASARRIRSEIAERTGVRPGVIVADSFGRPWRMGQTDVAIGAAGLTAIDDWRGRRDKEGRELHATAIAVADAMAGVADLARSKDSGEPVVVLRGLGRFVTEAEGPGAGTLLRRRPEDLFR